jgi:hypothetical protein
MSSICFPCNVGSCIEPIRTKTEESWTVLGRSGISEFAELSQIGKKLDEHEVYMPLYAIS